MAILDEEIVEQWLNQQGFFTMRGIKIGNGEIDLLAMKFIDSVLTCWHVEVQISYRPMGYIGGNSNAKKRNQLEIEMGVKQWIEKKFTSDQKCNKRNSIVPNANWKYILVCAELKDNSELDYMKKYGIEVHIYKDVLNDIIKNQSHKTSSISNNIIEIINYTKSLNN